ncbi:MAG: TIGR03767 family metallophosphoesterase [Candidatus Nanopelagicales bacterium]|nr:TIGR03767 family metallophosphoesterase [Candidatus Nanopelagicales bacterium]MCU0299176.1 TIGR03767 family metallophosphoesterase [Candidatus Nanopelagicales bacterium]
MAGISRRGFLSASAGLAAALGLPQQSLAARLAQPTKPADVPTTLEQTIRLTSPKYRQYRQLTSGSGEPYLPRFDVLGRAARPGRANSRRTIAYLGHLSDMHIMDAQSPARLDIMVGQDPSLWAGSFRPQDTLTVNVVAAMVQAMRAAQFSPLTGAPMMAAFNTGDSADMISALELKWYIDLLDGLPVTPNSGKPGVYEGVQVWAESTFAYHPEDPTGDPYGDYGFPTLPGMLQSAVSQTVESVGLATPWYAVYGNHDTDFLGTLVMSDALRRFAVGDRKAAVWQPFAANFLGGWANELSPVNQFLHNIRVNYGIQSGVKSVTADPQRKLLEGVEFMQAHLQSPDRPGPVGHGFTQDNIDTGKTYWVADLSPHVRAFGLDTCNQVAGPDGAVPEDQFNWLRAGLEQATAENKLCLVLSHHNSTTLENEAQPVVGPTQRLIHAEEFVAMLQEYPNCVAWMNGHTHINTIIPHPKPGGGGFWEVTTASCIDFPQQQQLVELVDNRDGTMSIFTTSLDHTSSADWTVSDYSQEGLASLSRQLSANDWIENPPMRLGSPLDRNCELLLPAPFDLSVIADADLEKAAMAAKARIVAGEVSS